MTATDRDWLREDVRARTSMLALVGADVTLRRAGSRHSGLCPFHREKTPSFFVNEDRGTARCFGCGWSGDVFGYVMERYGLDFPGALDELAVRAGLLSDREGKRRPVAKPVAERKGPAAIAAEESRRVQNAQQQWRSSIDGRATLAKEYLRSRGLTLPDWPPTLRYNAQVWHPFEKRTLPAMVAAIQGGDHALRGVHCTYLRPDGSGKADVAKTKLMFGKAWTGAIRLTPAAAELSVAEGIETALSILVAGGARHVWAAGSLGNMAALDLPPVVRVLHLWTDGDSNPQTMEGVLEKAARHHRHRGIMVHVHRAPAGQDWNDVLREAVA